jgi:hypothetical protein
MFTERHFGVLFSMLKFNLLLGDFRVSAFAINLPAILSIPLNFQYKHNDAFVTKYR